MKVPFAETENSREGSQILLFLEGQVKDFCFEYIAFKQVSSGQLERSKSGSQGKGSDPKCKFGSYQHLYTILGANTA